MALHVLSAGAAKAVVGAVAQAEGVALAAEFGAVGAMQERLLAGVPCDVLVLTRTMLDELVARGVVEGGSVANLGRVHTGIGLLAGRAPPLIADAAQLREFLAGASALYVPDLARSTAGQHVARMLEALGLRAGLAAQLREFPNGAAAMRAMVEAGDASAVGCTQESEIRYTPGASFVARLPDPHGLATAYAVAIPVAARQAAAARGFLAALTGEASRALRERAGFES